MEGEVIQIKQDRLNQMLNKVTAQLKTLLQKQSSWKETAGTRGPMEDHRPDRPAWAELGEHPSTVRRRRSCEEREEKRRKQTLQFKGSTEMRAEDDEREQRRLGRK